MTIKMKALRSFGVRKAAEGHVRRGSEFDALNDKRANELESRGLAHRVKAEPGAPQNKMEPRPPNKAAKLGPLPLAGGATGVADAPPSSAPDHPRQQRRSRRSGGDAAS